MDGGRSPGPGLGSRWRRAEGGGRLVARDRVRTALAVALSGALVLTVLAWLVDGDRDGDRVDDAVENVIDTVLPMGRGLSRALGEFVADLGSPVSTTLFMIAAALFAHLRCGPRALALVLVGPPVAMILQSTVLKPIIGRTRGEELAFPSGHTTSVTSIAIAMAVIVLSIPLAPKVRRWLLAALVVVPFAVAVCLVGRQYHYATDTVGAVGLALAVVLPVAVIIDAMADSLAEDPKEIGAAPAGAPAGHAGPPPLPGAGVGPGVPTARIDRPVGPPRGVGPTGALLPPGPPPVPMGPPPSAAPTERLPSLAAVSPSTEPTAAEVEGQPRPAEPAAAEAEATPEPRRADSVPDEADPAEPVPDEPTAAEPEATAEPRPADPVPVELVPAEPVPAEPGPAAEPAEAEPAANREQVVLEPVTPEAITPEPVTPEPASDPVTPDQAVPEPTDAPTGAETTDVARDEEVQGDAPAIPRPPRNGAPPPRVRRSGGRRSLTLRHPAGQQGGT